MTVCLSRKGLTVKLLIIFYKKNFVIVDDIPEITKDGPRALPSPNGDSVLHIYESNIYELQCNPSKCSWRKWPRRFTSKFKRKRWFYAMYIPEDITECKSEHIIFFTNEFLN